jgi:hypothetical protein
MRDIKMKINSLKAILMINFFILKVHTQQDEIDKLKAHNKMLSKNRLNEFEEEYKK